MADSDEDLDKVLAEVLQLAEQVADTITPQEIEEGLRAVKAKWAEEKSETFGDGPETLYTA